MKLDDNARVTFKSSVFEITRTRQGGRESSVTNVLEQRGLHCFDFFAVSPGILEKGDGFFDRVAYQVDRFDVAHPALFTAGLVQVRINAPFFGVRIPGPSRELSIAQALRGHFLDDCGVAEVLKRQHRGGADILALEGFSRNIFQQRDSHGGTVMNWCAALAALDVFIIRHMTINASASGLGCRLCLIPLERRPRQMLRGEGKVKGPPPLKLENIFAMRNEPKLHLAVPAGSKIARCFLLCKRDAQIKGCLSIARRRLCYRVPCDVNGGA